MCAGSACASEAQCHPPPPPPLPPQTVNRGLIASHLYAVPALVLRPFALPLRRLGRRPCHY